ncbi:MAG: Coenzyme F420 hydrogenase/dehydrogenase, beta subunit C-terminal domain [Pseudomonadota bacterium]
MSKDRDIARLSDHRLCLGCGTCAYVAGPDAVHMVDIDHIGVRPKIAPTITAEAAKEVLALCPTRRADYGALKRRADYTPAVDKRVETDWGAITGIYEGYASDPDLRFKGSSGGALTALAAYCMEKLGHHGTLHTGQNPADPIRNSTRLSRTRADLMETLGSRYSPAAVCEGLALVEAAPAPCVVIGKPVEIAGTRNAMEARPALAEKIGVTLSFFCAETPPTKATRSLMGKYEVPETGLKSLRYRGYGWPGYFATRTGAAAEVEHLIYHDAWAYLQSFRPWSTMLWPDGAGELADISCGDPWYEAPDGENPGFSLIVTRTKLGREIVEGAIAEGYLTATPAEPWKLEKSQEGLLRKKGATWGRRLAHRVMGMPVTQFRDLDLFTPWRALPAKEKLRSTLGTLRRIVQRGLWRA